MFDEKQYVDAIIAVGVLIKGETMHFEYIAEAVSRGLMEVQLQAKPDPLMKRAPVVFGVLTVLNEEQAWTRAGGPDIKMESQSAAERGNEPRSHNHGHDWGRVAIEMGRREKERPK